MGALERGYAAARVRARLRYHLPTMTLTRDRVVKAIRTPAATYGLCVELGRDGDLENLYLVLAAIAGGATEWFDDEMRIELRPTTAGESTVDVHVDIGDGRRERLFRSFNVAIGEIEARTLLDGARERLFPLEPVGQQECIVHSTLASDRLADDTQVLVEGTEPKARKERHRTIVGVQTVGVTLPFGLPLAVPSHAKLRARSAAVPFASTLPFGRPKTPTEGNDEP